MNKKFNKIMSLILVFCMLLTLIPSSIFTNIKAESATDVNNDNWEIDLQLYDVTNGKTPVNNIIWDSTKIEEKIYQLAISYKNTIPEKEYAPGSIQIEVDSILDNIRDCHDIVINGNFGANTPQGYDITYSIDADKASSTNKVNQWSYSVESTGKSYYNVPTKFIITNNETFEAQASCQGTIAITFTLNSNTVKSPSSGTYGVVFKTSDGTKLTTDTFDFNFTSNKRPYSLNIEAEKLKSLSGLGEDANNYVWAKYSIDYDILAHAGVREAFGKTLKIAIPEGAVMYDSSYTTISKSSDGKYDLGAYVEKLNIKTLLEDNIISNAKTFIVAFPKDTYSTTLDITAYLYGTYRDENSVELLAEKPDSRAASQFELDYEGELYYIGKTTITPNISYEKISTTGANAKWKLYYGAKHSSEVGAINMICGDDILYAQDKDYNWYQLSDDEYSFVSFNTTYKSNQDYYGLRNMGTGADVSDKYDVAIYVRYKGSSTYNLWQEGKLNASGIGANLTFPANVVGVKFKVLNSDNEDIELYGDLEVKLTSTAMVSDSDIYNFSYLEIEKIDGTPVELDITEENYITAPTKTHIMTYDQNTYGHLMFRSTDDITAGDSIVRLGAWQDFDTTSVVVDSSKETINFNYTIGVGFAIRYELSTTNEFIGYTLYDLLPEGIELNATEAQIKSAFAKNQNVNIFNNKSNTYSQYSNGTHRKWWEDHTIVEIIEDYQGTGRTLLKVQLDCKDDPIDLNHTYDYYFPQYGHLTNSYPIAFLRFDIPIPCKISFDNWYELGNTYTNYLYITDSNESKGYITELNRFSHSQTESEISYVSDTGYFDEVLSDIDGDGITNETIGYAKLTKTFSAAMNTYTDLTKTISTDGETWSKGTVKVGYNKDYSYKLRARVGVDNTANNLKIFDSIEDASTGWKGTLTGFNTSWAESKGYDVKIYYATTDFSTTEKYTTDLTNSLWSEYIEGTTDLSTIKHVAFVFYNSDGTIAQFEAGDAAYVQINMRSPKTIRTDNPNTEANELQTANNARFMIDSLDIAGNVVETVDLPSNTVYALLPSITLQILKSIPTDREDYEIMCMDPDAQYSFPVKFTHKASGQVVATGNIGAKLAGDNRLTVSAINLTGLKIGETYIIEEVLDDNSLFWLSNIQNSEPISRVSLNIVDGKYEFVIKDTIDSDDILQFTVNNIIRFKSVNLEISKEVIGTDRAFDYYGYSRTDSFDIKLVKKDDATSFKRAVVTGGGSVVIQNITPGTYILEETNLPTGWTLKAMTALNSIDGISMALVDGKYEITIANTAEHNSTFKVKISNELVKPTEVNLEITKEISGTDKAFEKLGINKTDEFTFGIKVFNKFDSSEVKQGILSTTGALRINDLHAGTWIIEETDIGEHWILKDMIALNLIEGITFNKLGNIYEIIVSENAKDNSVFKLQVNNELEELPDPFLKVIFKKTINGTTEAYESLGLNPNGEYEFQMNLVNTDYRVHGIVTNKEDLLIMELPIGSYVVTETKDPYFDFVSMEALNSVAGVTFTQENGNYILNVTEDITGEEAITIQVTNELIPDTYYNSKDEKINLFELNFEAYAIYSNTDKSLTFIRSLEEPVVGETYNGKVITNVYSGFETAHYEENGTPWDAVKTQITRVDFIHEIKPISTAHWFQGMTKCIEINCEKLNTENVTDMSAMFSGCKLLEVADVSRFNTSKVTSLYDMFYNCQKLKTIDVSNWNTGNVTDMDFVFQSCYEVESLNLKNWNTSKVTTMRYMFDNCKVLTNLDLSSFNTSKVVNMERMFAYCYDLESVNLTSFTFESAGSLKMMFGYCRSLKYLNLENFDTKNVTTMTDMLYGVSGLERITVGENFKLEGNGQSSAAKFPASGGALCNGNWYRVPDEVKFTAAELPDETLATYIGSNPESIKLTSKNYHLTDMPESGEVIIPETIVDNGIIYNVTGIGYDAFTNKNITKITIPKSVVEIDNDALIGKGTIEHIAVDSENPKFKDIDGVLFTKSGKTLIQYPESRPGTEYTVPNTTKTIGSFSFNHNKNLVTINVPEGVETIKQQAFLNAKNLKEINLSHIKYIEYMSFYRCTKLETVTLPSDFINYMGNSMFDSCESLKTLILPTIIEKLHGAAFFEGCSSLTSVTLPTNITEIERAMFYECGKLTNITIPEGVIKIGDRAFQYTKVSAIMPNSLVEIGIYSFYNNSGNIVFGDNLQKVGDYAFSTRNGLSQEMKDKLLALNPNAIKDTSGGYGGGTAYKQIIYSEQSFDFDLLNH